MGICLAQPAPPAHWNSPMSAKLFERSVHSLNCSKNSLSFVAILMCCISNKWWGSTTVFASLLACDKGDQVWMPCTNCSMRFLHQSKWLWMPGGCINTVQQCVATQQSSRHHLTWQSNTTTVDQTVVIQFGHQLDHCSPIDAVWTITIIRWSMDLDCWVNDGRFWSINALPWQGFFDAMLYIASALTHKAEQDKRSSTPGQRSWRDISGDCRHLYHSLLPNYCFHRHTMWHPQACKYVWTASRYSSGSCG